MKYVLLSLKEAHEKGWKDALGRSLDDYPDYQHLSGIFLVDSNGEKIKSVIWWNHLSISLEDVVEELNWALDTTLIQ